MYENQLGQVLGQYSILEKIDENLIGTFFHGRSVDLSHEVTIILFNPELSHTSDFSQRLKTLFQANTRLERTGLQKVVETGITPDFHFLIAEWLPGDSLSQLLEKMKSAGSWLSLVEAVRLIRYLALSLSDTRAEGFSYRIDPRHVHFRYKDIDKLPYTPVIEGWGLENLFDEPAKRLSLASPNYLSPEECSLQSLNTQSDIYSLGVLLFELITGQAPFPIQNLSDASRFHIRQPVTPPTSLRSEIPEQLQSIVLKALQKNPINRFTSPAELAIALNQVIPSLEGINSPPPIYEKTESLVGFYLESLGDYRSMVESQVSSESSSNPPLVIVPLLIPQEPGLSGPEIEAVLDKTQLSIDPGRTESVSISIQFRGSQTAVFRVSIEGIPTSWVTLSSAEISLDTNIQKTVQLMVRPPRQSTTRAGRYNLTIRVTDKQKISRFVQVELKLSIGVFNLFTSEFEPSTLSSGKSGRVMITNVGNAPDTYTIQSESTNNKLNFEPEKSQVRLSPGQVGQADIQASMRMPHLVGGEVSYPFKVNVIAASGQTKKHDGTFITKSLLPLWVLIALLILCLCATSIGLVILSRFSLAGNSSEKTSVAQYTGTYYSVQNTNNAATQTSLYLMDANAATRQSVTQTVFAVTNQVATVQNNATATAVAFTSTFVSQNSTEQANATLVNHITQTAQTHATQHVAYYNTATSIAIQATAQAGSGNTATAQSSFYQTVTAQAILMKTVTAQAGLIKTATAQAALIQTATSQAALVRTATTQASFLQTVTAQASILQTLTAQASTSTPVYATSTMVPTQTLMPQGTRLAYIYSNNSGLAKDFRNFLGGYGYTVDLIPIDAIPSVNFQMYQIIFIAPETGSNGNWGDTNGVWINNITNSNLPIIGLGEGGFNYFGKIGLQIGWPNGIDSSSDSIIAQTIGDAIWQRPYPIQIPEDGVITVFKNDNSFYASNLQDPLPANVIPYGKWPGNVNQFPIIQQDNRYILWGFSGSPKNMTSSGQALFLNLVQFLIGAN